MKTLDRYLLNLSLPPLVTSLLLLATVVLVSGVLPSLRWLEDRQLDYGRLLGWIAWQLPGYLVQALPIAVLLTILFVVGRMMGTQEYVSFAVAGVVPIRFAAPLLVLALTAALSALAINQFVLPVASARVTEHWWQLTNSNNGLWRLADRPITVGRHRLEFGAARGESGLTEVRLTSWAGSKASVRFAEYADYRRNTLTLNQGRSYYFDLEALGMLDLGADLALDRFAAAQPFAEETLELERSLEQLITQFSGGSYEDGRSIGQLLEDSRNPHIDFLERRRAATLFHRRLAEPAANLVLVLLALPLALLYIRSRVVGVGLAFVVALAWYLLLSLGLLLVHMLVLPAWIGAWGANLIIGGLGFGLLLRLRIR